MPKTINVALNGQTANVKPGTTAGELAKGLPSSPKHPYVLAKVDNEVVELFKPLTADCSVEFLDITDPNGHRAYQRSIVFLMIYAVKELLGRDVRVVVEHSINKNYYCELLESDVKITKTLLRDLEAKMKAVAAADMPIEKLSIPLDESIRLAQALHLKDKVDILRFRRTSMVNFYKLDWFYDYFYGPMVPSTGYLTKFKLHKYEDGFMIQFPSSSDPTEYSTLKALAEVSQIFRESSRWVRILEVDTVGALNNVFSRDGGLGDIIRISEALHEKKIAIIADDICGRDKSLVLIAGPSSSGKTTFSRRLSTQLRVNGKKPHVISLDNYYLQRDQVPLDEFGKPDLECLESIDVAQVNMDLRRLLAGEEVAMPTYNFIKGEREYKGNTLKLGEGDILVMEGIHGLNEKVTAEISKDDKFKVFISALTQLNLDDHNHIPTTDTRLLRRIVRDHFHRGFTAASTIAMWSSVQRGENAFIFPFQEEADAFFNSALVYEMSVLKQFAEPLLFNIRQSEPEYAEARRLVKFLDSFLGVSSEQVPPTSILREFIGGSCYKT